MSLYKVETEKKQLAPLPVTKLSEQQLTERYDLQEWLAHHPQALGEPLLIIQKEFSGFDGTGERLDLLALDTQGNLVLIENKRDQTGKDVVWQAIKYASYVAPFTVDDIIEVYANYLLKNKKLLSEINEEGSDLQKLKLTAKSLIDQFLEEYQDDEMSPISLNTRNSQRLILVAGDFRKEVTSTALWMLDRGIDVKCIKVVPYLLDSQLLIQIQQIIPVPEASEYMVRLSRKEAEEVSSIKKKYNKDDIKYLYWTHLLEYFEKTHNNMYTNISPKDDHWLNTGSGISGCAFTLIYLQKMLRVEFSMGRGSAWENKVLFDYFESHKTQIEAQFGAALEWLRLDSKKSSRIQYSIAVDSYDQNLWESHFAWHSKYIQKMHISFKPFMQGAYEHLKLSNLESENT